MYPVDSKNLRTQKIVVRCIDLRHLSKKFWSFIMNDDHEVCDTNAEDGWNIESLYGSDYVVHIYSRTIQ